MARVKIICPKCRHPFELSTRYQGSQISCPICRHATPVPLRKRRKLLFCLLGLAVIAISTMAWVVWPLSARWPDRRPIGVLMLASTYHSSATNPRGWFNDKSADFMGPGGKERFRKELLNCADISIANLKRLNAQGVIVWDLEGEEFPHKTSYIGDPRLLTGLAPEMAAAVDEFFKRFTNAGLRVGVTIRPQELVFDHGLPRQAAALDIHKVLLDKIDFARTHWGATIFYIDSNDGFWRPDEVLQLRLLQSQRPGVLLIPEHHDLPYWAFSAPYVSLRRGDADLTARLARKLFPSSFSVLDIADASPDTVAASRHRGDILLFRAWYWNSDCQLLESIEHGERQF